MKKKSPKADLESKRPYFFKIGLIIACSMVWFAFEWETAYATAIIERPVEDVMDFPEEDELMKAVIFKKPAPKPPVEKKKAVNKVINTAIETFRVLDLPDPLDAVDFPDENEGVEIVDHYEEPTEDITMMGLVQFKPRFPGCEDAGDEDERFLCFQQSIMKHIQKNFRYPGIARDRGKEGKVYVKFVIDKKGLVTNISVDRAVDRHLGEEASRLIESLPQMIPARQYNKPVAVEYVVPINFQLK